MTFVINISLKLLAMNDVVLHSKMYLNVESRPHIQAYFFVDTQSQNEKPKELEFCQHCNQNKK